MHGPAPFLLGNVVIAGKCHTANLCWAFVTGSHERDGFMRYLTISSQCPLFFFLRVQCPLKAPWNCKIEARRAASVGQSTSSLLVWRDILDIVVPWFELMGMMATAIDPATVAVQRHQARHRCHAQQGGTTNSICSRPRHDPTIHMLMQDQECKRTLKPW